MEIIEKHIQVNDYVTKSNLPASDYVINPYVGCPHGCKYCYASFMKRFTGHKEDWGTFIDIKQCENKRGMIKIFNLLKKFSCPVFVRPRKNSLEFFLWNVFIL